MMLKEKEENCQIFRHTCKQCNNSFDSISKRKVVNFCSEPCRQLNRRMANGKNMPGKVGIDFIVCPICNQRVKQITVKHAKMHGYLSQKDMKDQLGIEITCEAKKELSQGENNPGYQHNGKFSPFSKKFTSYKGLTIEEKKAKIDSLVDGSITKRVSEKNSPVYPEYWIKQGYSEEEAQQKVSEQQTTFNLEICIEKYGKEEGLKRWNERQEKWLSTMDEKSDEEKLRINSLKAASIGNRSKAEKEIEQYLKKENLDIKVQYLIKKDDGKYYSYDIFCNNKIIEYNGDFWHCNPKKYDAEFYNPRVKKTAQEIWDKDVEKIKLADDRGYEILTIWETDYKQNKQKVIEECISFLTK